MSMPILSAAFRRDEGEGTVLELDATADEDVLGLALDGFAGALLALAVLDVIVPLGHSLESAVLGATHVLNGRAGHVHGEERSPLARDGLTLLFAGLFVGLREHDVHDPLEFAIAESLLREFVHERLVLL